MLDPIHHHSEEAHGDPGVHALAVAYFDNLKNTPLAHRLCMDMVTNGTSLDDRAKFVCYNVINEYIGDSYGANTSPESRSVMRHFLGRFVETQLASRLHCRLEKASVSNVAATIFARVCLADYPHHWNNYFAQLVTMVPLGPKAVRHYLRTLSFIGSVVSEEAYSSEEDLRYSVITKAIQEDDLTRLLEAWLVILSDYDEDIRKECLIVIGEYLTWLDPSPFVTHHIIPLIADELESRVTREDALRCFYNMLKNLKTDGDKEKRQKFAMEVFHLVLLSHGFGSPLMDDVDFSMQIAELMNVVGMSLLTVYDDDDKDPTLSKCLDTYLSHLIRFLDCGDSHVSASVIPFVESYMCALQKVPKLNNDEYDTYICMLESVLARMRMKSHYMCDDIKTEMAVKSFYVYRKLLINLFRKVMEVNRKVVFKGIHDLIINQFVLRDWSNVPFHVAEYPVFLLNLLRFVTPVDFPDESQQRKLQSLVRALLACNIMSHPHSAVTIQFFQAIGQNVNYFYTEPTNIRTVLLLFLNRGLKHAKHKVRHQCAEHFLTFVKELRLLLGTSFLDIIETVRKVTITTKPFNDGLESGYSYHLHLLEASGIAIASGNFHAQNKRHFVAEIIVPAMHTFHNACRKWVNPGEQDHWAKEICHAVDIVAQVAKGFDSHAAMTSGCDDVFVDTVTILDHCTQSQLQRGDIHASMTRMAHQMVRCLGDKLCVFIPKLIQGLLFCKRYENVCETYTLIVEIINRYRRMILGYFKHEFYAISRHLYETFTMASLVFPMKALSKEKLENRQCYLSFIVALVGNDMFLEIFSAQEENHLLGIVYMIASSTIVGCNVVWRSIGVTVMTIVVELWACPYDRYSPRMIECIYNYIVMCAFVCMHDALAPTEEGEVAPEMHETVFEKCSHLLRKMYLRRGATMLIWMGEEYLSGMNVGFDEMEEMVEALMGDSPKRLDEYLRSFFKRTRGYLIVPSLPAPGAMGF